MIFVHTTPNRRSFIRAISFLNTHIWLFLLKMSLQNQLHRLTGETTICFLPPQTNKPRSRAETELVHSSAKGHVTRLQHRLRTAKRTPALKITIKRKPEHRADPIVPCQKVYPNELKSHKDKSSVSSWRQDFSDHIIASEGHSNLSIGQEQAELTSSPLDIHRPSNWLAISPKLSNPGVIRLFQFSTTVLWPTYDVARGLATPQETFTKSWQAFYLSIQSASTNPGAFHGTMWVSAVWISHHTLQPIVDAEQIKHKQLALRSLSSHIQKTSSLTDGVLAAILPLMNDEIKPYLFQRTMNGPRKAFQPPFKGLQWLDIHGRQPFIPLHWLAVIGIINDKGGLDSFDLPTVVFPFQYGDIIQSTLQLHRPSFYMSTCFKGLESRLSRDDHFGFGDILLADPHSAQKIDQVDTTMAVVWLSMFISDERLLDAMKDLRCWCHVLDHFQRSLSYNPPTSTEIATIGLCRNILQYKLLSTAIPESFNGSQTFGNGFTACADEASIEILLRTSLLIISIGVTFPVSFTSPWQILVSRLSNQLQEAHLTTILKHYPGLNNFLLWCSMVGCLGAIQIDDAVTRNFFIETMCRLEQNQLARREENHITQKLTNPASTCSQNMESRTWDEVRRSSLSTFVWSDESCNVAAKLIWDDVRLRFSITRT